MYRLCLVVQPPAMMIEDAGKWQNGQVNSEYPQTSGGLKAMTDLVFTSILGSPAPNMSVVVDSGGGYVDKNQTSPTGCYGSIHRNESDLSFMPIEYPILDFTKVDPVQVLYEGPLNIFSIYEVDQKGSIVYVDLLKSSVKSFKMSVWFAIMVSFFVFSALLLARQLMHSSKNNHGYSPMFETLSHLLRQGYTDFADKSGRTISIVMTFAFFFILAFFLNLISTDLVVVVKPQVINNYRDVMNRNDMKVAFSVVTYDAKEFVTAVQGSIQQEFWTMFGETHVTMDLNGNMGKFFQTFTRYLNQQAVIILNSFYTPFIKAGCKMMIVMQKENAKYDRRYTWVSSDPEGMQHPIGLIMRQGINTDLIIKGQKRLRRLFEGGVFFIAMYELMDEISFGPITEGSVSVYEIRKCMSKQLIYHQHEVERVNVRNFRYLSLVCVLLFLVAFAVLLLENIHTYLSVTRVTPM